MNPDVLLPMHRNQVRGPQHWQPPVTPGATVRVLQAMPASRRAETRRQRRLEDRRLKRWMARVRDHFLRDYRKHRVVRPRIAW